MKKINQILDVPQFASEYPEFFHRIYVFLKNNPDVLEKIEKEVAIESFLEFFNEQPEK